MRDEHPDRAFERFMREEDARLERERREDRIADHTPASENGSVRKEERPRVTGAMVVLAWTILNGPDRDKRDAAKVLAEIVVEADEQ